jgi:hypothetical protein
MKRIISLVAAMFVLSLAWTVAKAVPPPQGVHGHWNNDMCGSNDYERIKTKLTEFAVIDSAGTCVNATEYLTRFAVSRVLSDISWQFPAIISGYVPEGEATCASVQRDTCFGYPVQQRYDGAPLMSFKSWLAPGIYNESVDTWFSHTKSQHSVQNRSNDTEIMIWTAYPGIDDASRLGDYVTIDGMRFGIMSWEAQHSGTTWRYVAYLWLNAPHVRHGRPLSIGGLYLNPFFRNAESHGWLSSNEYLWAIDLGFELVGGGRGNNIHDYKLTGVK